MGLYQNRIVVKVGTSTLMNNVGKADLRNIEKLVRTLADIKNLGYDVILVSSGAIAMGVSKLKIAKIPETLKMKQAISAVGQCNIINLYDRFFSEYDKTIAQILLSAKDVDDEEKRNNLTNTFDLLLGIGVVPIVNENDSIANEEIVFGDNDMLSSIVAKLCRAKKFIILRDSNGLNMESKTKAAKNAESMGIDTYIIDGKNPECIYDIIENKIEKWKN